MVRMCAMTSFIAYKNKLLEITLVKKLVQIIEIRFKEIFTKMGGDKEKCRLISSETLVKTI